MFEAILIQLIHALVVTIECVAVLAVSIGAGQAVWGAGHYIKLGQPSGFAIKIRQKLGRWLILGLEFLLAADILQTVVDPTWSEIGQLAAIATIRTALDFFLEKELHISE